VFWIRSPHCTPLPRSNRGGNSHGDGDGLAANALAQTIEEMRSQGRSGGDCLSDGDRGRASVGSRGGLGRQALTIGTYSESAVMGSGSGGAAACGGRLGSRAP
jgi:hypothetical protein